jgi:uncharacterized membrane protein
VADRDRRPRLRRCGGFSDTDLQTKAIRHTALRRALVSYLFGTAMIAMTINIVAGLAHEVV